MKSTLFKNIATTCFMLMIAMILSRPAQAQIQTLSDYTAYPPFITTAAPPLTMFVMSKDHKLFYRAYNDVTDLDEDGTIDTTYRDTIDYYGYFDPKKCYDYVGGGSGRFEPSSLATGANSHSCSNHWSGNFLNWATMARIDVVRKVLYGGYRETDTATNTVLGRTVLPQDAHSWTKAYTGSDIASLTPFSWSAITLCNTNTSDTQTSSLLYAINGNFPYSAGTEGQQCVWEEPTAGTALTINSTYNVDVQVCVIGMLEDNCIEYKDGSSASSYKPSGLLQKFGVDRKGTPDATDDTVMMKFGLMTGSYGANISGGVLRSNITDINAEIDNVDGTIKNSSKIIQNIDQLRVLDYNYSTGWYASGSGWPPDPSKACVPPEPATLINGFCKSWGNPIGEMLYETIRYFQGQSGPTSEFQTSPPDPGLSSLSVESSWSDPYDTCPACSKPFAIILSDEFPSNDSDDLPGSFWPSGISTSDTPSVQTLMDTSNIDTLEGIGSAFIGESAGTFDRNCTSKTASFKNIRGLCIEEPTKEGSFYMAGLAHYARTTDLNAADGDQKMRTYAISTGSSTPNLEFTAGGLNVQIVPSFRDDADDSKGALVDFQFCPDDTDWTDEQSNNSYTSCYDIMWDDAEYGWDYDLDIRYRIYVKTGTTNITVKTKGIYAAAGHLGFAGFIISGVTGAGEYLDIACGDNGGGGAGFNDCDRFDAITTSDGSTPNNADSVERTFTVTGSTTGFLKSPLWYAAKYGGFEDSDNNNTPNLVGEWDKDGDGIPDTFFNAANPLKLESQLVKALTDILKRSSSGTSVSVLATAGEGEGALYQAYFFPSKFEGGAEKKWIGHLHGLFLDAFGNLREDTNQDGRLVYNQDKIVQSFYDAVSGESKVNKFLDANGDGKIDSSTTPPTPNETVPISQMVPIWEAGEELALTNPVDRKIYTWVNANHDGIVDTGEFREFKDSEKTTLRPYLRAVDDNESADIINFIRGDQISGMRDRLITIPSISTQKVWKLGDIVYSTPTTVAAPRERYDQLYGDASYLTFYNQYKNRRNVVYVGGNDGMLHAFNAGFYNPGDDLSTPGVVEHGYFDAGAGKKLGQELWSYIPYELLPHLKWLTMPEYTHVYYVDLKPKIVDAKIFTADADHPNGWGTVLIGGMRMGGGSITVDDPGFPSPKNRTFQSAYFVLDITNPELPPKLLASFTDNGLNFTTSSPTVIRVTDGGGTDKWLFMMGSGPTTYSGTSTDTATVYAVNLKTGTLEASFPTGLSSAFMGDAINVDGNLDFKADVAYIGSSYSAGGVWGGNMYRLSIQNQFDPTNWVLSTLYEANPGPMTSAATAAFGTNNKLWIYFGTGRYFTPTDALDTSQQRFYGIKDPCWNDTTLTCTTTITDATLRDTTGIKIFTDASVANAGSDTTFSDLYASALTYDGWYYDLGSKERVLAKSAVLGGSVFFTTFVPNGDACSAGGTSYLFSLFFETGTAYPPDDPPPPSKCPSPPCEVTPYGDSVAGLPSAVGLQIGAKGGPCKGGVTGFVQQSTGTISQSCQEPPGSIRSGVKGWRDF